MWTYQAPVADMLFLMTQALDAPPSWAAMPAFAGLGAVGIRAELVCDGVAANGAAVTVTGGKNFISGAEGLALAIVPKILPDGSRNSVFCDGIKKKRGINGSATCRRRCEGAHGCLIGEPNRGSAPRFVMMNSALLHVGLHGLGHQDGLLPQGQVHWGRALNAGAALPFSD